MRTPPPRLLAALALAVAAAGCGKATPAPDLQKGVSASAAPSPPGAPGATALATKNTTRLGGDTPQLDAAAVAQAVYPGLTAASRPQAAVLVDEHSWGASIAAAALASAPLGAPLLYADGERLPPASARALQSMRPMGSHALGGAQVIRIGTSAPLPGALRARTVPTESSPALAAAAVEQLLSAVKGRPPRAAILLVAGSPAAQQMPAAGLAAESGAPILFVNRHAVPAPTRAALRRMHHPTMYAIGASALSAGTVGELARLGHLTPVAARTDGPAPSRREGAEPVANAVSVSRFADGPFGWGVREAGHGLVFANPSRPLDAPAAAPLSAHGDYGPLLLTGAGTVPSVLARYLSDIEPGYTPNVAPVREVYNHGWLIGDEGAISALVQAEIDAILEVAPRTPSKGEAQPPPPE